MVFCKIVYISLLVSFLILLLTIICILNKKNTVLIDENVALCEKNDALIGERDMLLKISSSVYYVFSKEMVDGECHIKCVNCNGFIVDTTINRDLIHYVHVGNIISVCIVGTADGVKNTTLMPLNYGAHAAIANYLANKIKREG